MRSISEREHDIRQQGIRIRWRPSLHKYRVIDESINHLITHADDMLSAVEAGEEYLKERL